MFKRIWRIVVGCIANKYPRKKCVPSVFEGVFESLRFGNRALVGYNKFKLNNGIIILYRGTRITAIIHGR